MKKMKKAEQAVSDVLGTILLLGMAIALFSVLSAVVLTYPFNPSPPTVNVIGFTDENDIILDHRGGESLSLDTKILIDIAGENFLISNEIPTVEDLLIDSNNNDQWDVGEEIRLSESIVGSIRGKQVTVNVVDIASSSIIMWGMIQDGVSTPPSIETNVNTISPYMQTISPCTLSASGDFRLDSVALWYRYTFFWEDNFDNDDNFVSSYHNMTFTGGDNAIVTSSGGDLDIEDYVDIDTSDVDSSADKGSHSNFNNEKAKDLSYDTLTEGGVVIGTTTTTFIDQESFEGSWPPTGWSETGNWDKESNQKHHGTYSADFDGSWNWGSGRSGNLHSPVMDCSDADSINVDFWYYDNNAGSREFELYYYDNLGNWDYVSDLGNDAEETWNHYTQTITSSQYRHSNFQVRWRANSVDSNEHIYVDLVTVEKDVNTYSYELDLEAQWTGITNYDSPNEELCIYAGTLGSEDLIVEAWDGSNWQTIFNPLNPGWNNESIHLWLTDSTFTIRYRDGTPTSDSTMDSWDIDTALIHTWSSTTVYYEGNITTISITKPSTASWDKFYADVDNPTDSTFSILDGSDTSLLTGLDGNGNVISSITDDTIRLYGSFNGLVRLDSWNVSTTPQGTWAEWSDASNPDTIDPWGWDFNFANGIGNYEFYSIGTYDVDTETPPSDADARCYFNPD